MKMMMTREPDEGVPRIPGSGLPGRTSEKRFPHRFCQAGTASIRSTYRAIARKGRPQHVDST
jgi:hypothetical protein